MNRPVSNRLERFALSLVLTLFVLISLGYSVIIPLGEAPDEVSHFSYVRYLTTNLALPPAEDAVSGEAHQPPLYYLLGAALTAWIPDQQFDIIANPDWQLDDPSVPNVLLHTRREAFPYHGSALAWHLLRGLSVVLGGLTIWATWQIAQCFMHNGNKALAASAFIAFLPGFTYLSATVNNDNLIILLSALALLVFLRQLRAASFWEFVLLGSLLGLAVLAKISALPLGVVVFLGILFVIQNKSIRWRIGMTVLTGVIAILVISPWVIYNTIVFGDPINWARFLQVTPRIEPITWGDWLVYGDHMFKSLGGRIGGASHLEIPGMFYLALAALFGLALAGMVLLARDWRSGELSTFTRQCLIIFGLFWFLLLATHIRLMIQIRGMDQARHIFAGLPSFSVVVVASISRLMPRRLNLALSGFIGGMAVLGVTTLIIVSSWYAAPSSVATLNTQPVLADFGGLIRIVNYRVETTRKPNGASVLVQIDWQAANDVSEDYWLLLQLVGPNGVIAQKDAVPGNGRTTTDWWHTGQLFHSLYTLTMPRDTPDGRYALRLGLHPPGRWEWLPVRGQDMLELATIELQ